VPLSEEILEKLNTIRMRRKRVWYVAALVLPVPMVAYLIGGENMMNFAGYSMMFAWLAANGYASTSRCPRCGEVFSRGPGLINPWRTNCGTCGLNIDGHS